MPAITSTEDLIRLLREDATFREAARRELLGDELLGMPRTLVLLANELRELQETVARFIESTDRRLGAIEEHVATTESDVGVLKSDVGVLKSDVGVLKSDVGTVKADNAAIKSDVGVLKSDVGVLKSDVGTLKADNAAIKSDVGVLKSDVGTLKADNAAIKSDVGVLKSDVGTLKADNAVIKSDVGVLKSDVGTLKGRQVEDVYRRTAPSRFRGVAGGLSRMVVLDAAGVAELADEGRAAGVITADEADSLVRADLVATAVSPGGQVVIVAEISGTVHQDDVERAMERAAIAGKVTGMPAVAVVAGDEIARVVASEPVWAVTGHSAKQLRAARRHTA
ncbi:MAG: hypothetical protein ACYCTL_08615 [Acidimicrobiales bacterium]